MTKKLLLGTLGGALAGVLFSMIIYMGFMQGMSEQWMKEFESCLKEMNMIWWIVGSIIMSLFVTILFIKLGVNTLKGGAITGTWITFFMMMWYGIFNASTFTAYPWEWLPIDLIINTVTGTVAGAATGWILGKVS